jgi:hypothetical protein
MLSLGRRLDSYFPPLETVPFIVVSCTISYCTTASVFVSGCQGNFSSISSKLTTAQIPASPHSKTTGILSVVGLVVV